VSTHLRDAKPKSSKAFADAMISDDSILQGFLMGEVKRTPDQTGEQGSSDQMRESFKTESDNTVVRKKRRRQEVPAYLS
jgi:hypothetical protein